MTNRLVIDIKCRKCRLWHKNIDDQEEKLHDDVEPVTDFPYLGDRIISGGGCEAALTSIIRLVWIKFREYQDLLCKEISSENQRNCIQRPCEMSNALWK